mgnify:CR=1 FL=1
MIFNKNLTPDDSANFSRTGIWKTEGKTGGGSFVFPLSSVSGVRDGQGGEQEKGEIEKPHVYDMD